MLRATRLLLGAVSVAGRALPGTRRVIAPGRPPNDAREGPLPPDAPDAVALPRLLPAAVVGVGLAAQRRALESAAASTGRVGPWVGTAIRCLVPAGVADAVRRHVVYWSARGEVERLRAEEEAVVAGRALIRALTAAVLDQLDLDAAVARVDVNRVADRVDVDRIADRIDLVALTEQVLEAIDIGRVVRDTSGGLAEETLDAFRVRGMHADQLVDRAADRLLRRAARRPPLPRAPAGPSASGSEPETGPPRGPAP